MTRKAEVFLQRYLKLVERYMQRGNLARDKHEELAVTVADLAMAWDCSPRAVRETLGCLRRWSLIRWRARSGRGQRSVLTLLVHPVHVYFTRAERAVRDGRWAEAAFWYAEIMADCPCIPVVPERLARTRLRLGLAPSPPDACCEDLRSTAFAAGAPALAGKDR